MLYRLSYASETPGSTCRDPWTRQRSPHSTEPVPNPSTPPAPTRRNAFGMRSERAPCRFGGSPSPGLPDSLISLKMKKMIRPRPVPERVFATVQHRLGPEVCQAASRAGWRAAVSDLVLRSTAGGLARFQRLGGGFRGPSPPRSDLEARLPCTLIPRPAPGSGSRRVPPQPTAVASSPATSPGRLFGDPRRLRLPQPFDDVEAELGLHHIGDLTRLEMEGGVLELGHRLPVADRREHAPLLRREGVVRELPHEGGEILAVVGAVGGIHRALQRLLAGALRLHQLPRAAVSDEDVADADRLVRNPADDVEAIRGLDDVGDLVVLEREGGLLEGGIHGAGAEAQEPAQGCGWPVLREIACRHREAGIRVAHLSQDALGERERFGPGADDRIGAVHRSLVADEDVLGGDAAHVAALDHVKAEPALHHIRDRTGR